MEHCQLTNDPLSVCYYHTRDINSNAEHFLEDLSQGTVEAIRGCTSIRLLDGHTCEKMVRTVSELSSDQLKQCVDDVCDHLRNTSMSVKNAQALMNSIIDKYDLTEATGGTPLEEEIDSLVFHSFTLENKKRYEALFDCLNYQFGQDTGYSGWPDIEEYLKTYDLTQDIGRLTSEEIARIVDYGIKRRHFTPTLKKRRERCKGLSVDTTRGRAELE